MSRTLALALLALAALAILPNIATAQNVTNDTSCQPVIVGGNYTCADRGCSGLAGYHCVIIANSTCGCRPGPTPTPYVTVTPRSTPTATPLVSPTPTPIVTPIPYTVKAAEYSRPVGEVSGFNVTRILTIYRTGNEYSSIISLKFENVGEDAFNVYVDERIPVAVAANINYLKYAPTPMGVLEGSRTVRWKAGYMPRGEIGIVNYTADRLLDQRVLATFDPPAISATYLPTEVSISPPPPLDIIATVSPFALVAIPALVVALLLMARRRKQGEERWLLRERSRLRSELRELDQKHEAGELSDKAYRELEKELSPMLSDIDAQLYKVRRRR